MAVNEPTKRPRDIHDFLPSYGNKAIETIFAVEIITLALIAAALFFTGYFRSNLIASIIILAGQAIVGFATAFILLTQTSRPLKDIISAIVHVSGELSQTTPPNPNDPRYADNGFKEVLQTLYELDSQKGKETGVVRTVATNDPLRAALDETACGIVVMNHARVITYANKAAPVNINATGQGELQLIFNGQDTLEAWLTEQDASAVHAERTWPRIPDRLPEEEGRRFFDVLVSYDKGAESEVVIALIDRTKLYDVGEQELDFIAFAAHELRGPITVIRGYIDVLQSELAEFLQPDQKELFHRLTVSANRLSGYINNILNTSRYDRRHLTLHLSEQKISDIYDMIRDDMALRASAQNRLLQVDIPADLPTIAADVASLSEVIGNLIDNAIKYSNEGGVITVKAAPKETGFVTISVEDHGIGMPSSVVSNLFQKFYRSHRSRETVAGTGIGLYISKAIVESHGGNISVRSEEGKGSTFLVDIPTYASVADKLKKGDNNQQMITESGVYIKNHSMQRG